MKLATATLTLFLSTVPGLPLAFGKKPSGSGGPRKNPGVGVGGPKAASGSGGEGGSKAVDRSGGKGGSQAVDGSGGEGGSKGGKRHAYGKMTKERPDIPPGVQKQLDNLKKWERKSQEVHVLVDDDNSGDGGVLAGDFDNQGIGLAEGIIDGQTGEVIMSDKYAEMMNKIDEAQDNDNESNTGKGLGRPFQDETGRLLEERSVVEEQKKERGGLGHGTLRGGNKAREQADKYDRELYSSGTTEHAQSSRNLQELATASIGLFNPLSCNPTDWSSTTCTPLSSSIPTIDDTTVITVPCGACYTYDLPSGSTTSVAGLDIHGKLIVPENYSGTLVTPYVFVQGVLDISNTDMISPTNVGMQIVLNGEEDVTFVPVEDNADVGSFNAGVKPFLVAGGQVNVNGWNGPTEEGSLVDTWTPLLAMSEASPPNPTLTPDGYLDVRANNTHDYYCTGCVNDPSIQSRCTCTELNRVGYERSPITPNYRLVPSTGTESAERCPMQLVNHDFEADAHLDCWTGTDGKIVHHDHENGTIVLNHIDTKNQGFRLDFTEMAMECPMVSDAPYLITLRLKIDHPNHDGEPLPCSQWDPDRVVNGKHQRNDLCPRVQRKIMRPLDYRTPRRELHDINTGYYIQRGSGLANFGEWFHFTALFKWSEYDEDFDNVIGNIFYMENFPLGSTITLDDFVMELPSRKSYADPNDVCTELVINGSPDNVDGNGFNPYPFWSPDYNWFQPTIKEEIDDEGDINRFYRIAGRRDNWYIMRTLLNTECLVKGFVYKVSARVRVSGDYSGSAITLKARFEADRASGSWTYPEILSIPDVTTEDGWVYGEASLIITDEIENYEELRVQFWTEGETITRDENGFVYDAVIDIDDFSIAVESGPAEGLLVDSEAVSHWGAGSEIHITSTTLSWTDSQVAVIDEVIVKGGGKTSLKLSKGIDAVLTEADTPGMGAEVALLTRNIKIEGHSDPSLCGTDRLNQADYNGTISVANNGQTCINWSDSHRKPENYPDYNLGDHNSCRYTGDHGDRAWCYTSTSGHWDYCSIPSCQGAYMQVFHTPNVPQTIDGVEFQNMGRQKEKNRFPIQFLYTRDVAGSSVSRNTIRNTMHRCISMDGVSNVTIAMNVAHDTSGHCYYMGYEATDNLLLGNLGSATNREITWGEQLNGDNDHDPATFYFRNPENDFIGNVAAGSAGRGWEAALHWAINGEDNVHQGNLIGESKGMRYRPLGTFRNNKAHTNDWQGFRFHHFEQFFSYRNEVNIPVFENMMAYRHREHGIYAYNVIAADWRGGKVVDNQLGITIRNADRQTVSDYEIIGATETFKNHIANRPRKFCDSSWHVYLEDSDGNWARPWTGSWVRLKHLYGLMMSNFINREGESDPREGLSMNNVNISGYGDEELAWYPTCTGSDPVAIDLLEKRDGHFNYISTFNNVNVDDDRGMIMDGCRPSDIGVSDIVINDADGSMDPARTATKGALVQGYDHITGILPNCNSIGHCMAYCSGVCLRTMKFKIEQHGTADWKLRITNTADPSLTMDVPSLVRELDDNYVADMYAGRTFQVSLPEGSYTAEFLNEGEERDWPTYVEETWQKTPECSGFAIETSITLLKPESFDPEVDCLELARDYRDVDGILNSTEPWSVTYPSWERRGIAVAPGMGMDGKDAIKTVGRSRGDTGVGLDIDTRCLEYMQGEYYELSVWMKSVDVSDFPYESISRGESPQIRIRRSHHRDSSSKEFMYTAYDYHQAYYASPYNPNGWNLLHGFVRLPYAERVFFEIERAPGHHQYIIDHASYKKMTYNPDNMIMNGDLESGSTKFWKPNGNPQLSLVEGYGGGQAISASGRNAGNTDWGMAQIVNVDVNLQEGDRIAFSARMRYLDGGGNPWSCNIGWGGTDKCSYIKMYTKKDNIHQRWVYVAHATSAPDQDGWAHVTGVYSLEQIQAGAQYVYIYYGGTDVAYDMVLDNMEMKYLPKQCLDLVLNPDFSDSSAFWETNDGNVVKLSFVNGAGGEGDSAMRVHRTSTWNGHAMRQRLDHMCFGEGDTYIISAKFRLLDAASGDALDCNTNTNQYSSNTCPSVRLVGNSCTTGGDPWGNVYQRFWNTKTTWNKDEFNDFEAAFDVNAAIASCDFVWLYIDDIIVSQDIIVDDLQISAYQTEEPTSDPTFQPTSIATQGETDSPTSSPTPMPTVSSVTTCPAEGSAPTEIPSGISVMLAHSATLCILTKATPTDDGLTNIAPIAISYDNDDWEAAAGSVATDLLYGQELGQFTLGTQIYLPSLAPGAKYFLTTYSHSVSDTDKVARLLESATFGSTADDIATFGNFTDTTANQWVIDQMNLEPTSHRKYFRERANHRLTNPVGMGKNSHPCDSFSRWRKVAFSEKEGAQGVTAPGVFEAVTNVTDPTSYITIKLNNHVRTVVRPPLEFEGDHEYDLEFNREYKMCQHSQPQPYEGGSFRLLVDETSGRCEYLANPLVHFYQDSAQPAIVLPLPGVADGVLYHINEVRSLGGEYILANGLNEDQCGELNDVTEETDSPVFGKLPDGSWLQFDPRVVLEGNTVESPIPDGGGLVKSLTGDQTKCANAARTFLNEEHCTLSESNMACGSAGTPNLSIELSPDNIQVLHDISGQYIYAIEGLPLSDVNDVQQPSPCTPELRSRWLILKDEDCLSPTAMGSDTNATLVELLLSMGNNDYNPYLRDIYFPLIGKTCDPINVSELVEVDIVIGEQCFRRVHPDHLSVYDFSFWALEDTPGAHPGNMMAMMHNHSNPIKKWMDGGHDQAGGSVIIHYPAFADPSHASLASHPIQRWDDHNSKFPYLGRFGDDVRFVDLPNEVRLDEVAEHFDTETGLQGGGILACGSPFESANDPSLGKVFETVHGRDTAWDLWRNREYVWFQVGLTANDQLRQRVAWAFAQLLVVARGAIGVEGTHSEVFLTYYDIFVRHAFGNYRDILQEISFSPLMAENLSFLQSKSAAYTWEHQNKISFADENFAREIMQLFSTGLDKLNLDGTPVLDDKGKPVLAYTNDEIMSFARVWTGFDYQQGRGNVEETSWSGNRHDPMTIQASWRDKFPKTDMNGGYIGDGYPLCVDLPDQMFLKTGGSYRLLGASHMPELMEDDPYFKNDLYLKKFVLNSNSTLKAALCDVDINGNCQYKNTVTLDSNLPCTDTECNADTVRVVQVNNVHYEFVRPACVEQVFYADAKKVINKYRNADSSCANPLLSYASEACCEGTFDQTAERYENYLYDQERVKFSTANDRCQLMGMMSCDFNTIEGIDHQKKGYHWTTDSCQIKVKVNDEGQVALVYEPESYEFLHPHVRDDNRNFFKVYWDGEGYEYPKNSATRTDGNGCGNSACVSLSTGGCLCDTTISQSKVFNAMPASTNEVFEKLSIGAYDPSAYEPDAYAETLTENGIKAYLVTAGLFDTSTVFEVKDKHNRPFHFKNTYEQVRITGATDFTFRNAPSFMSVLNSEADRRDAYYETEAALDHYFYHDNTAPFIAIRLIQRFTTSNPKPRYVEAVAKAFQSGTYVSCEGCEPIGQGTYGDLAATIAAVLLDREARSINMDADPFKGNLREPLLRVMALMRGMNLELNDGDPWGERVLRLNDLDTRIGQMAHSFPTVFSFMLPEYKPDGRAGDAGLVGPETMIMDMPKVVSLLNGMFSMVKYGVSSCYGGFGPDWGYCEEGANSRETARLTFSRSYDETVVDELATILTSGRLSNENKNLVKAAYTAKYNTEVASNGSDPAASALRLAQQLILVSPEFHTNQIVKKTGAQRPEPQPPQASGAYYKAVVYVMFGGGADSYNMLVPHTCTVETSENMTLWDEYQGIRQDIALDHSSLIELDGGAQNQNCSSFGVHPMLGSVQQLYNQGDLLFFANAGVLTKPTDKENYWKDTETQLFAHNWMQLAAQRIDPLKTEDGTGVLGRIRDVLANQGLSVGAFSLNRNSISLIGTPGITATPMILSGSGVSVFNEKPSAENMTDMIAQINGETAKSSGVFGEWYSETLMKSLSHNQLLHETLQGKTTVTTFPNSWLGSQLSMVAKMIDSRVERATDADVFFLDTGGWDTHSQVISNQERLFADVDASFKAFADEMNSKGTWEHVTLVQVSDFARTLTQNGNLGSDHAWGGNYIMTGGAVKGKQIVGHYPSIKEGAPLSIGRGRIIPTTSWESVFKPLAQWAGVETEADLNYVLPNRHSFPDGYSNDLAFENLFEPPPTQ